MLGGSMARLSFSPLGRRLVAAGLVTLGLAGAFALQVEANLRADRLPPEQELLLLPRPGVLRLASLGHTELLADLVWVREVLYFGDELSRQGDFRWMEHYLAAVVTLDPHFRRAYTWGGIALIYNGRSATNGMVQASNALLERGLQAFPDDWELNFMLGANYLHELKTADPKQKRAWKLRGAEHMRRAALSGKGPPYLPVLVATVLSRDGDTDAAVRHLEEILLTTEDEAVRTQVRNKLKHLQARSLGAMERAREAFKQRWQRELPYVHADMFVILGDRPQPVPVKELAIPELMRTWAEAIEDDDAQ
jgi:hypothetical protein